MTKLTMKKQIHTQVIMGTFCKKCEEFIKKKSLKAIVIVLFTNTVDKSLTIARQLSSSYVSIHPSSKVVPVSGMALTHNMKYKIGPS